jgi:hypothetical protein
MSVNALLFAVIAGILTFILMNTLNPMNPIVVTNILLGLIAGQLMERKKSWTTGHARIVLEGSGIQMRMKIGLLLAVILVTLTGCFSKENNSSEPTPSPTPPVPASSHDFKLSAREQEVYNNFQKDLNEQHLKVLEPISIAKLYVQARLDNKNDVVYALYTDKNGHVEWTKEEHEKFSNSDSGTKEQILKTFNNIETGKFVQTSEFEGYVEYQSSKDAENKSGFKMIKDDDGIWNVSFQPIQ